MPPQAKAVTRSAAQAASTAPQSAHKLSEGGGPRQKQVQQAHLTRHTRDLIQCWLHGGV